MEAALPEDDLKKCTKSSERELYPNLGIVVILEHKEECVQKIAQGKIYLLPEAIQVKDQYFSLEFADTQEVLVPYLLQDEQGYFFVADTLPILSCHPTNANDLITLCKHHHKDHESDSNHDKEKKEAQEHYNNARKTGIEALGHSMAAGLSIECPPVFIIEGYQAVQSWKEMGDEYCKGVEAEKQEEQE